MSMNIIRKLREIWRRGQADNAQHRSRQPSEAARQRAIQLNQGFRKDYRNHYRKPNEYRRTPHR